MLLRRFIPFQQMTVLARYLSGAGNRLVKEKCYVNGEWVGATSGDTFPVTNPYNGEELARVPDMTPQDAEKSVVAADKALEKWRETTAKERGQALRRWYDLMTKATEDLAKIMTLEQGKPLAESRGEIAYGASYIEWFAEEARRIYGEVADSAQKSKQMLFIRQPIGVVGMITPWNFPNAMITRKAAAALAAGCTCVVRPSEDTPLSALAAAQLAEEAGIPPGVFNVVTSSRKHAAGIGKLFCESPLIAGISFTGSTAVGKLLYNQCSQSVKRLGLELGGNAPCIVFDSADLDVAVNGVMTAKFRNSGQTCVAINRIFAQKNIFNDFVQKLGEAMRSKLVLGDGLAPETNQGPLINEVQALRVEDVVKDAINKGAKLHTGGKRNKLFYEPTLLTNLTPEMTCYNEEIFGPVATVTSFDTEADGLALANATRSGLAGYFFSQDYSQIWRVARKLEVGMVGINESIISACEAAFGGIKESGMGREGSKHGMDEYTYVKYLCFGNLDS